MCGLELDTGGGNGAANIGGGNVCIPSGTGGGVGLGTDVAVAGDSCEAVLLLRCREKRNNEISCHTLFLRLIELESFSGGFNPSVRSPDPTLWLGIRR